MSNRRLENFAICALLLTSVACGDTLEVEKWQPTDKKMCQLLPDNGKDGGCAMSVIGAAGGKKSGYWKTLPQEYRPDTCYGISFWLNRYRTGSKVVLENAYHWVVYSSHITSGWTELKTVFKTPSSPTNLASRLSLGEFQSQGKTLFDQIRMVELLPLWRKVDGLELGHGEIVCGNRYSFVTHLKAASCAVTRPFVGVRNGARSGFIKMDIPAGGEVLYRFALPERRFNDGEATIAGAYCNGGRLMVEGSVDGGANWSALACLTDATPYKVSFPVKMFPCSEMLLRLRMEGKPKERMHVSMVGFSGRFEGRPARLAGATRFVEKDTGYVFLDASPNDYRVATFGERLPVSVDGISLWRASSGCKVFRDAAVSSAKASSFCIKTAANEAEAAQLVITPKRELKDVRVGVAGPLKAKRFGIFTNGEIPASSIDILRVHYIDIDITTDQMGVRGAFPDALPPQDDALWPAKAGESTPFWIRVKPPKGTPKGVYCGSLIVSFKKDGSEKLHDVRVPFEVEVFGFDLPDRMTIMTPFGFSTNILYRYHCASNASDRMAIRERYLKYLGDNHISPYGVVEVLPILKWKDNKDIAKASLTIDWSDFDREVERQLSTYHFNAIRVPIQGLGGGNHHFTRRAEIAGAKRGEPLYERLMEIYLGQVQRHFEEKDWIDLAYVYWFDEPMGQQYEFVNAGMLTLKKYAPKLKRMITNRCTKDLMDGVNTWCPVPHHFHVPDLAECRERGDNLWWYICCSPPNTQIGGHIDHPGTDMRTWLWQAWGEGVTGILIWTVNWWTGRVGYPDDAYPQDPYLDPVGWGKRYKKGVKVSTWSNGEGRFVYPPLSTRDGRQGRFVLADPVACIRMEMLRDGIEDYEYFAMLKRCDSMNPLLAVPKSVYRAIDDYSSDPSHMENHREKLARAIERAYERNK